MKKNDILIMLAVAVVFGLGGFFGGKQYQKSHQPAFGFGQRLAGQTIGSTAPRNGNFQRPVSGEIISQDDKSVTVKMQDGSTKIVIVSDKTAINKATEGTKADLKTGEQITVMGTANSDGSLAAQTISIGGRVFRPETQQLSSPAAQPNQ